MSNEYDVIVVGGGLAGLTSAAYLSRHGYSTLLCEKSGKTGGLVNTFCVQGYAFDSGVRAFENSGIVFPMLRSLGIELDFVKNPVSIGIRDQWITLSSRESLQDYGSMLTGIFPESATEIQIIAKEIKKVMQYMDVLYGIDNPLFLDNMNDPEYLLKTLLPWLMKYQVNIRKASRLSEPVKDYLQKITENQALIDMIVQHFFEKTPTFFALSYFGLYLDYCYPKGGTGVLAQKVSDYICSKGGEILTDTAVLRIDSSNKQIFTADAVYTYRKLVWAADQKTLYAMVNGPNSPGIEKQRRLAEKSVGGDSVLTVFLAVNLNQEYFQTRCGAHAFYTPETKGLSSMEKWDMANSGKDALFDWVGDYLERTTYEMSCPALRDPALAPEGKTGIIISTLMEYKLVQRISELGAYEEFKEFCIQKISEVLEQSIFPGLRAQVECSLCGTPLTIERETGNAHGAITGWAFTNAEVPVENKFKSIRNSIKTPIEDVYQCGQWTFSPSGLPVSILTGKLAADEVIKNLK